MPTTPTTKNELMLSWFENLVHPYTDDTPQPPPRGFFHFVWACTFGVRKYILAMTLLTASVGVFEALLFAMMGRVVDWLGKVQPALLWTQEKNNLLLLCSAIGKSAINCIANPVQAPDPGG